MCIGACHGMHRIKAHTEPTRKQCRNSFKIKQFLHQHCVVSDWVNDFYFHISQFTRTNRFQIVIGCIQRMELGNFLCLRIDQIGYSLGRRSAIWHIVFQSKIGIWATWIVACG